MEANDSLDDNHFIHFLDHEHRVFLDGGRIQIPPRWIDLRINTISDADITFSIQSW
jgi:hypothetical protein